MDQLFGQLALVATLVERIVQLVKPLYQQRLAQYQKYIDTGLVIVGNVGLCYLWNVDLFAAVGFQFSPVAGSLLTGALAWLGSEVIHTVVEILATIRKNMPKPAEG